PIGFIAAPTSRPPANRAQEGTAPRSLRLAGQLPLASPQAAKLVPFQNAINKNLVLLHPDCHEQVHCPGWTVGKPRPV
ncbi:MAG: hypothetical protein ACYC3I_19610, partial [Gemmataceae bacterium]